MGKRKKTSFSNECSKVEKYKNIIVTVRTL